MIVELDYPQKQKSLRRWIYTLLLVYVLIAGAYLRLRGIYWGEYQYLHPDERFLVWVGTNISPVKKLAEYWDTANSSLNPENRGHGFYVYGTLPMFLSRYLVEWIYGHSGFDEMTNVGRPLSALFDLGTVLLVYLVAKRLFDERVGVLAAAFSAFAVLQIQHAHFFTMDTFTTFFAMLAVYFAVLAGEATKVWEIDDDEGTSNPGLDSLQFANRNPDFPIQHASRITQYGIMHHVLNFFSHPLFLPSLWFGIALGMATASKLNAASLAFLLPLAMFSQMVGLVEEKKWRRSRVMFIYLVMAAVISLLVFRLFQPYAFTGPGFLGLQLNPNWLASLRALREQQIGDLGFPPNIQWYNRPVWFAFQNMVLWGMGLPLGLLAWAGFMWIGWRMIRGEWRHHILLWTWTGLYFVWQSLPNNPSMRYQLPIYPTLAIFAAWAIINLWDRGTERLNSIRLTINFQRVMSLILGGIVLIATAGYAYAFSSIYVRPITRVEASRWIYQMIPGPINLRIQSGKEIYNQPQSFPNDFLIRPETPFVTSFVPRRSGDLIEILLHRVVETEKTSGNKVLQLTVSEKPDFSDPLATATLTINLERSSELHSGGYLLNINRPAFLSMGETYYLELALQSETGAISVQGTTIANEGAWDDPLPIRLDDYDGFGGIYQGLNFDMYEVDNPDKLARFLSILNQAEYILISSSRQWGSLPRILQRFPMNAVYYRTLIGCPPERSVEWCYNVAQPGDFQGELGFDLINIFESSPTLGMLRINDQFSEEAFTVYDHPKVFIFKKRPDYDPTRIAAILGSVDLSRVNFNNSPEAVSRLKEMMLPADRLAAQQAGGTWSWLFNTRALQNRFPSIGLVLWYLALGFLGLISYPLVRYALRGLPDHGYPLTRTVGLLLISYLVWLAGSFRFPFTRLTISILVSVLALVGFAFAYLQREELAYEWRARRRYFLLIEGLFLAFFAFDLLIRLGNPDLWHPWKGGEKPMDFSYFNAVLKSTSFPPYDPWFSGGYINYYYYGFVLVGTLVKWLGIVPSVAYNLILPTIFGLIAMGAFSIGWNLIARKTAQVEIRNSAFSIRNLPFWIGLFASLNMAVLGNLGTLRMIYHGYQRIIAPEGAFADAGILTRWMWAVRGMFQALSGTPLPYGIADWYWIPSRAIPAPNDVEPITEFPFFTVLYGDPHAHLFALPLTLLVLSWAVAVVLGRAWESFPGKSGRSGFQIGLGFLLGGLAIGSLRPTNTWDFPTYLALGVVGVGYAVWRNYCSGRGAPFFLAGVPFNAKRWLVALAGVALLVALAFVLFQPYASWYVQGYTAVDLWKGTRTPFWSYLTHWGLFLFVIVSWMIWETRDWMASTPISAVRKLAPYRGLIKGVIVLLLAWVAVLLFLGVKIAWLVLPLAAWAGVLIFRPGISDAKRVVLFMAGTALILTLMVEVIVLRGDIGRMNTVFKFYLQAWTLFAISAAASLGWLLIDFNAWTPNWRMGWQLGLTALVASAALYPLLGGMAKIKDRMAPEATHTLDGMAFMKYATYADLNTTMDLSEDYRAIHWLQENLVGSPVIVEGNMVEYHWGTRYTIYTGLPNVVGWNWHQRQQRASLPEDLVTTRVNDVNEFYLTQDYNLAQTFLEKYTVRYIIVGQLERALYPGPGLDKFEQLDGTLWREVYRDRQTVFYEVMG